MGQVTNVKFTVNIEGGHDALVSDPHAELGRILGGLKFLILNGVDSGQLRDFNGNTVGDFHVKIEREED